MPRKTYPGAKKPEPTTERFKDGSQLVTYPEGSMMILESELAQGRVIRESGEPVKYPLASEGTQTMD